jgi:proline iminopeptidase
MRYIKASIIFLFTLFSCSQKNSTLTDSNGFVKIEDTKLYYNLIGSGDTLVVLHGGPGLSHKYLKPQLDSLLSDKFTLLYYDQRGSGWSDGVKDTTKLNMEYYINDLDGIRNHFNLSKLNLVGHSFGGLLAMYYGIAFPR